MEKYTQAYKTLNQKQIDTYFSQRNKSVETLANDEDSNYIRETSESLIFQLNKAHQIFVVDIPKKELSSESKARLAARALASTIVEKENLFGANKIFAVNPEKGIIVRENELGKPIKDLEHSQYKVWNSQDLLNLMITLDRLIQLDIAPKIDTESVLLTNNEEDENIGFIVTDYAYQGGYKDRFTSIQERREYILHEIETQILPEMKRVFPQESLELDKNFQDWKTLFLDTGYLDFESHFDQEAQAFEPALSAIAAKIDHNNSIGVPAYQIELTQKEQEMIIGEGGECIVIKGNDPNKIAKIYYKGDGGAFEEIKALEKAQNQNISNVAKPIAYKGNIVIEERLPGENLEEILDNYSQNETLEKAFKKHLPDFFKNFENLYNNGIFPDPEASNILFDQDKGFFFPDLSIDESRNYKDGVQSIYQDLLSYTNRLKDKIKNLQLNKIFEECYENYIIGNEDSESGSGPNKLR